MSSCAHVSQRGRAASKGGFHPLRDADGYILVPTGPGLGVEPQPEDELVRKYPFESSTRYAPTCQALQV
jgi:hypothetical protein